MVAFKRGDNLRARTLLQQTRKEAGDNQRASTNAIFASTSIAIDLAAGNVEVAIKEANRARQSFPLSRGIARQYAQALLSAGRAEEAASYLRDQVQQYRKEVPLYRILAQAYSTQGKKALMHLALAEAYWQSGGLSSALEQLSWHAARPMQHFMISPSSMCVNGNGKPSGRKK